MKIKGNQIYIRADVSKVKMSAAFMKKMYRITKWLSARYGFNAKNVEFHYGYNEDDFAEGKVTIRFTFHE